MSNAPKTSVGAKIVKSTIFATTALSLGMGLGAPAFAQEADAVTDAVDIVVTARRTEERLQDVPISITVFNQEQLANLNIVNAADLAQVTPGMYANRRFGDDNSTFAIRGFTQELRTTPSVGVYFAEVVAPRGGGAISGGDGAGPGAMFDLQNVQVLRGPQGTLFGRNTTGGAVLLVPQRPTDEFGGYIEGQVGSYDLSRVQGVLNVPLTDWARLRVGFDSNTRGGYLDNTSNIGPEAFNDINYNAYRASLVLDLASNLENYTIVSYSDSQNNGVVNQIFDCNSASTGFVDNMCTAAGQSDPPADFHSVHNFLSDPESTIEQWQAINTTTWDINDNLTLKNIVSFASFESTLQSSIFGSRFNLSAVNFLPIADSAQDYHYTISGRHPGLPAISTDTLTEEIQLQGRSFGDRLTWQAGLYYEHAEPDGNYGQQSLSGLSCDLSTVGAANPADFRCEDPLRLLSPLAGGFMIRQTGTLEFENMAAYAQGTFEIAEQLKLNVGIRYTRDETTSNAQQYAWIFNGAGYDGTFGASDAPDSIQCVDPGLTVANSANIQPDPTECRREISTSSEAPTWMIGLDYNLSPDVLLYTKYARGYRQGGIVPYAVPGFYAYGPEEVDTYELGAKTSFDGPFPGVFNIAAFYNDFRDQQIQSGLFPVTGVGTTAIVNAGASTIYGLEIETNVELFENFTLAVGYTYLNTNVDAFTPPTIECATPGGAPAGCTNYSPTGPILFNPSYNTAVGQVLPYSPENTVSVTGTYRLPTPEYVGRVSLSANWVWTDEQQAFANQPGSSPHYTIDAYGLLNLGINWEEIAGSNIDGAVFVTNALDEEYVNYTSGTWRAGFESRAVGQPFMAGARLRYRFGGES